MRSPCFKLALVPWKKLRPGNTGLVTNISCFMVLGFYGRARSEKNTSGSLRVAEGAPSLRFLQGLTLSLSKGWMAMQRMLFDLEKPGDRRDVSTRSPKAPKARHSLAPTVRSG